MFDVLIGIVVGGALCGVAFLAQDYLKVRRAAGAGATAFNFIQQQLQAAQAQQQQQQPQPKVTPADPPAKPQLVHSKKEE